MPPYDHKAVAVQAGFLSRGMPLPAVQYELGGGRLAFTVVIPFQAIEVVINEHQLGKGINNRPLIPDHWKDIKHYLETEPKPILGAITLNADPDKVVFMPYEGLQAGYSTPPGTLQFPIGYKLPIADGQHRIKAIIEAVRGEKGLALVDAGMSITGVIVMEKDDDKVKQDFLDMNKNGVPPKDAILVSFSRDPLSQLAKRFCDHSVLFNRTMIDFAGGQNIGAKSPLLFTIAQLRSAIAAFLLGSTRFKRETVEERTRVLLSQDPEGHFQQIRAYFDALAMKLQGWKDVVEDKEKEKREVSVPLLRTKYLHFSSFGFNVLALIGHYIVKSGLSLNQLVDRLGALDWSRTNPMWVGIGLDAQGKVMRGGDHVENVVALVLKKVEVPLPERLRERVNALVASGVAK